MAATKSAVSTNSGTAGVTNSGTAAVGTALSPGQSAAAAAASVVVHFAESFDRTDAAIHTNAFAGSAVARSPPAAVAFNTSLSVSPQARSLTSYAPSASVQSLSSLSQPQSLYQSDPGYRPFASLSSSTTMSPTASVAVDQPVWAALNKHAADTGLSVSTTPSGDLWSNNGEEGNGPWAGRRPAPLPDRVHHLLPRVHSAVLDASVLSAPLPSSPVQTRRGLHASPSASSLLPSTSDSPTMLGRGGAVRQVARTAKLLPLPSSPTVRSSSAPSGSGDGDELQQPLSARTGVSAGSGAAIGLSGLSQPPASVAVADLSDGFTPTNSPRGRPKVLPALVGVTAATTQGSPLGTRSPAAGLQRASSMRVQRDGSGLSGPMTGPMTGPIVGSPASLRRGASVLDTVAASYGVTALPERGGNPFSQPLYSPDKKLRKRL